MSVLARPAPLLVRRLVNDVETPVAAFVKAARGRRDAFLLESVEGGEKLGRYSVIGLRPDRIWRVCAGRAEIAGDAENDPEDFRADEAPPLASLRSFIAGSAVLAAPETPPMAAGVFGYLGYDMAREMERLPPAKPSPAGVPDALFLRPQVVAVFDNLKQEIILSAPARMRAGEAVEGAMRRAERLLDETAQCFAEPAGEGPRPYAGPPPLLAPTSNVTQAEYLAMVARAKDLIGAGEIFQAVLSQRFSAPFVAPPFELYRALRRINPSPFMFYFDFGGFALVGSSPEILVRVRDGEATIRPIAGTRPRGRTPEEDAALAAGLLADEKECAEHLMLLDLGRNDVGRVAEIGAVRVTESFTIERYSHVMHIVSNVVGRLRKDKDAVDAVIAGFPAGTVTGAPKIRAMEIIDALEPDGRGVYGGAVGYFSADGAVDACIALRTALVKDGVMQAQAGAGIVADSAPEAEYEECRNKAAALFAAAGAALAAKARA